MCLRIFGPCCLWFFFISPASGGAGRLFVLDVCFFVVVKLDDVPRYSPFGNGEIRSSWSA